MALAAGQRLPGRRSEAKESQVSRRDAPAFVSSLCDSYFQAQKAASLPLQELCCVPATTRWEGSPVCHVRVRAGTVGPSRKDT